MLSHFQAKVGREKECEASLQRLRGKNTDYSQEAAEIKVSFELNTSMSNYSSALDLMRTKNK